MFYNDKILIGKADNEDIYVLPKMANRHGVITGATGTGKTITLKVLAESFSDMGIPVFLADVKGDIAGMCKEGIDSENMQKRIAKFSLNEKGFRYKAYPTAFFDLIGKKGLPIRTTISELGPVLLSKVLDLNDVQTEILTMVFKIADDANLLLIDTKDLKATITSVIEHSTELSKTYGKMSPQSLTTILRSVMQLEEIGATNFLGEPAIDIKDFFRQDPYGKGYINILDSSMLIQDASLYSIFMLYLLSELFEVLPEVGDLDKPRMIFFFDEAHLLFKDCSKTLLTKIEQVVKLIRSKGVGIYFITQSPSDIPDTVLAQLNNKIVHALHAYTPKEQKALKTVAESFRVNPKLNTMEALQELGTGEALCSFLQEDGSPSIVKKVSILPPQSLMGSIDDQTRENNIKSDILYVKYYEMVDRESAYEILSNRINSNTNTGDVSVEAVEQEQIKEEVSKKSVETTSTKTKNSKNAEEKNNKQNDISKTLSKWVKGAVSTAGSSTGRSVASSLLGKMGVKKTSIGGRIVKNVGANIGRNVLGTFIKF